jgi:hypothetical protein
MDHPVLPSALFEGLAQPHIAFRWAARQTTGRGGDGPPRDVLRSFDLYIPIEIPPQTLTELLSLDGPP